MTAGRTSRPPTEGRGPADLRRDWHTLTADEAAERLGTSLADGLADREAKRRLGVYGPNRLLETRAAVQAGGE